jgi:hypothetical protein
MEQNGIAQLESIPPVVILLVSGKDKQEGLGFCQEKRVLPGKDKQEAGADLLKAFLCVMPGRNA